MEREATKTKVQQRVDEVLAQLTEPERQLRDRAMAVLDALTDDRLWSLLEAAAQQHNHSQVALYRHALRGHPGARLEVAEQIAQAELAPAG